MTIRTRLIRRCGLTCVAFLALSVSAMADYIAYDSPLQPGNQDYPGFAGLQFDVIEPIQITALGVFDSSGDGLQNEISVGIYSQAGVSVLAPLVFFGSSDTLIHGDRFRSITPVTLGVGNYMVVTSGYGGNEPFGNTGFGEGVTPSTLNTGGGLIAFVGPALCCGNDPSSLQGDGSSSDPNRYVAGTFEFAAASPEPATWCLLLASAVVCAGIRRRSRLSCR